MCFHIGFTGIFSMLLLKSQVERSGDLRTGSSKTGKDHWL